MCGLKSNLICHVLWKHICLFVGVAMCLVGSATVGQRATSLALYSWDCAIFYYG